MYTSGIITLLRDCLEQETNLIECLNDDEYQSDEVGPFRSSVGKHLRHNLDHFTAFFEGLVSGRVDYETRQRNHSVENSRSDCGAKIRWCVEQLSHTERLADQKILVRVEDGKPFEIATWVHSSTGRELQFLLGHTVHHHAIIAMLLSQREVPIPEGFGVAPSTQRYEAHSSVTANA